MFGIGPMELMAILVVALLVFGPKRIPELAQTLGRGLAEFRRASNDLRQSLALDELQRDLRKDLDPNQTIHRPDDRPAQAGGDLKAPDKTENAENAVDENEEAVAEKASPDSASSNDSHPGELPTGDEHDFEHRDTRDGDEVGDETSVDEDEPERTATSSTRPTHHANQPADSELGNVPVSGTKPADPRRG